MFNFRQKLQIFLLIVFTIITFIAPAALTKFWAIIPLSLIVTLTVDFMFLNDSAFNYEPDYNNWKHRLEQE